MTGRVPVIALAALLALSAVQYSFGYDLNSCGDCDANGGVCVQVSCGGGAGSPVQPNSMNQGTATLAAPLQLSTKDFQPD